MDFHWDWTCNTLFEEGCHCSNELPPRGAIAHVGRPGPEWPFQVTWMGARCQVMDFYGKPTEQHDTFDQAVAAVEEAVRNTGHTVDGA